MEEPITIYTEASPNPNSIKFVVNFPLVENINFDFPSKEEAEMSPLAYTLFEEFPFVKRVFIASNFVTLTKDDSTDWYEVNPEIKEFLLQYFRDEKPLFTEGMRQEVIKEDRQEAADETEIDAKIKAILKDYVAPAVEQDGGAIAFHSFDEGKVKVLLQGACSGCPSSTMTLKAGIENLLKRMVPEVTEVEAEGV